MVNNERLPPESDDVDRTEQDKEQSQLDPRQTNAHVDRCKSSRRFRFQTTDELSRIRVGLFPKYIEGPRFSDAATQQKVSPETFGVKGSSSSSSPVERILTRRKAGQEATEEMSASKGVVNVFIVSRRCLPRHFTCFHQRVSK